MSATRNKGFFVNKEQQDPTTIIAANSSETTDLSNRSEKGFFKSKENEETSGNALMGLLFYSITILFLPLFIYFGVKQALEDNGHDPPTTTIGPSIVAIASVNIIIILYVIKAFNEEKKISKLESKSE